MEPDLYDISGYSDQELFDILELDEPSDRMLEAKILSMVRKYDSMEGGDAKSLMRFFIDMYTHFFDATISRPNSDSESESESESDSEFESQGVAESIGRSKSAIFGRHEVSYESESKLWSPPKGVSTKSQGFTESSGRTKMEEGFANYGDGMYANDQAMKVPSEITPTANRQPNPQGNRYSGGYGGQGYADSTTNSEYTTQINRGNEYGLSNKVIGNNVAYSNFVGNTIDINANGQETPNNRTPLTQTFDVGNVVNRGRLKTKDESGTQLDNTQLTKQVDYSKDVLNPLLKQTIKRVISIDSQYRENKQSSSTEFTFNLSEPLKDVVSLKLYSIQIPFTWYTINGSFGGNFFYIKGNSPGIDNGDHDYKVEIPSGNYTASSLVDYLQTGIKTLKDTLLDVSFGTTEITYNPNSVLSTIAVDMKEVFGESNYYMEFPATSLSGDTLRNSTLNGFFGYDALKYDACAVYSNYIPNSALDQQNVSIPENTTIELKSYTVGNTIVNNYTSQGESYIERGSISIRVPAQTNGTIRDVVSSIHNELLKRSEIDATHSFVRLVENPLGNNTQRIQINIKWNRTYIRSIEYFKTAVLVPTSWITAFRFPSVVNETSHIISENTVLPTKYIIEPAKNTLRFECIHPGYTRGPFDYTMVLPASSGNGYKLEEYIQTINETIQTKNIFNRLDGTRLYSVSDTSFVNLDVSINTVFTNAEYDITFFGTNMEKTFNVEVDVATTLGNQVFTIQISDTSIRIDDTNDKIRIRSKIDPKLEYIITFPDIVSNNYTRIVSDLSSAITTHTVAGETDEYNQRPFKNSTVAYDDNTSSIYVSINVSQRLTNKDYRVIMSSLQTPDTWTTNLRFDNSYNLSTANFESIQNNAPVRDNQYVLTDQNHVLTFKSFPDINGLTSENSGVYDITIDITPAVRTANNKYTMDEIYDTINARLAENPLTVGSEIRTSGANYSGNTVVRLNINKVFRTEDYRLVFYDPYSFVSCYSGASRNGSKSVQNATWDTTIGWILGFRGNIIYYLDEYKDAPNSERIRYNDAKTVCILTGDTTVSTSLYNYFLIALDDYTQNHLNDGLVTITRQETSIEVGPYNYVCNPYNGSAKIAVPIRPGIRTDNGRITGISQKELYTFNEKLLSKQVKEKSYSKGPFVKDIFGIIPIKTSGLTTGSTYVEFGGTLQNQERMYFGPVNIHRMTIRLLNDRGDMVDLNNANWSFSLVCEQLYRS